LSLRRQSPARPSFDRNPHLLPYEIPPEHTPPKSPHPLCILPRSSLPSHSFHSQLTLGDSKAVHPPTTPMTVSPARFPQIKNSPLHPPSPSTVKKHLYLQKRTLPPQNSLPTTGPSYKNKVPSPSHTSSPPPFYPPFCPHQHTNNFLLPPAKAPQNQDYIPPSSLPKLTCPHTKQNTQTVLLTPHTHSPPSRT